MEAIALMIIAFVVGQIFKNMKYTQQNRPGQTPPQDPSQPTARRQNTQTPPVMPLNFPNDTTRQIMEAFGRAFDGENNEKERQNSLPPPSEEPWHGSLPNISQEGRCYDSVHEPLHERADAYKTYAPVTTVAVVHRESKIKAIRDGKIGTPSIQGVPMDEQQIRRAIIMAEIIGPPKSRRAMAARRLH